MEKREEDRIDSLFGGRRHRFLVVCDEGVFLHQRPPTDDNHEQGEKLSGGGDGDAGGGEGGGEGFVAVSRLREEQPVRCVDFHPSGDLYAVGANSRALSICAFPSTQDVRASGLDEAREARVVLRRSGQHKGSLYCVSWNATGDLLATGSNDKTLKLMRFSECQLEEVGVLRMHVGTVRAACFMEDLSSRSNLLISGGGDSRLFVTDCETARPFHALQGHTGAVRALCTWGGVMFVSSAQDRSVRFWDMRTRGCVHHIPPRPAGATPDGVGNGVAGCLAADPSGRLLVSGHEDGACRLYDMRARRPLAALRPHGGCAVRSTALSPRALYLLSAGADGGLAVADLQGDLTQAPACVRVAGHSEQVVQARWHPEQFAFASASADKTCVVWALPPQAV